MSFHPEALPQDAEIAYGQIKSAWPVIKWVLGVAGAINGALVSLIVWMVRKFANDLVERYEAASKELREIAADLKEVQIQQAGQEGAITAAHANCANAAEMDQRLAEKLPTAQFDAALSSIRADHARMDADITTLQRTQAQHGERLATLEAAASPKK